MRRFPFRVRASLLVQIQTVALFCIAAAYTVLAAIGLLTLLPPIGGR